MDIGANDTKPQINLEDLSNIKQLEALFRAQTLMAVISGNGSPFHEQHCLMAYACIVRIWQVRLRLYYIIMWSVYLKLSCGIMVLAIHLMF